jgi:hypothetical protein
MRGLPLGMGLDATLMLYGFFLFLRLAVIMV